VAGPFYFAWTPEGEAFDPVAHAREDEKIVAFSRTQNEGEFATLDITIRNPRIGLLNAARDLWAWFSVETEDGPVPLFYGRLVGVPQEMQNEAIQISLIAAPVDFDAQKEALADTWRVLPYFDPALVAPDLRENPDTVLEALPMRWHIDPISHEVTLSDIVTGEDGVLTFERIDYESLSVTYGQQPAHTCKVSVEFRWKQKGVGNIDFSPTIAQANGNRAYIFSYTGEGLLKDWPKVGAAIGSGWTVGTSTCEDVSSKVIPDRMLNIQVATGGLSPFVSVEVDTKAGGGWVPTGPTFTGELSGPRYYNGDQNDKGIPSLCAFPLWALKGTFTADYSAERDRVEQLTFTLTADVQDLVSDRKDDNIDVTMTSSEIDQPIDADGALPIGDIRRTSYLLTDRGQQSLRYLILLGRARLLSRARAVSCKFRVPLIDAIGATLRHSVTVTDPRLPGGTVAGKVTNIVLALDGSDGAGTAEITLECTIGHGGTVAAVAGSGSYVDPGYVDAGYQVLTDGVSLVETGDVTWADYSGTAVADDGINFLDMRAADLVLSCSIVHDDAAQETVLTGTGPNTFNDVQAAISALNENYTQVAISLKPLNKTEPFTTAFPITVSELKVPKTIDLGAASSA
jgi:hypothetical protein